MGRERSGPYAERVASERFESFVDPVDGTRWSVDMGFLGSRWTCIWGNGCQGILETSTEHLGHGCCSVGTELLDDEEAMLLSALAASLDDDVWQFRDWASDHGIYEDDQRKRTITVEGGFGRPFRSMMLANGGPPLPSSSIRPPSISCRLRIFLTTKLTYRVCSASRPHRRATPRPR